MVYVVVRVAWCNVVWYGAKCKIPAEFSKMAQGDKPSLPGKSGHCVEPKTLNQQLVMKEAMSGGNLGKLEKNTLYNSFRKK